MKKQEIRLEATLTSHTERVWHVAWCPTRAILASCSTDKSVQFSHYSPFLLPSSSTTSPSTLRFTPSSSSSSSIQTAHNRTVRSLDFSPDGKTLATASFDATVGIWQQRSSSLGEDGEEGEWEAVDPLEGHESECKSVAWSADGRLLASCSRDKSVWVWEHLGFDQQDDQEEEEGMGGEFECVAVLMEHSQDVKCVKWHPTPGEEVLASCGYDDTVKLYSPDPYDDEWGCTHTLKHSTATVWSVSFSPKGQHLATVGDDLTLRVYERRRQGDIDVGEKGEAKREEGGRMGPWSSGGVRIGVGEKWRWDLVLEKEAIHDRTIYSVDWGKGGEGLGRILTVGADGKVNIFQVDEPLEGETTLQCQLVASMEEAHGVSDINHAAWCTLDPIKYAEAVRRREGGERDPDDGDDDDEEDDRRMEQDRDTRLNHLKDVFATAGDDGLVKVWRLQNVQE